MRPQLVSELVGTDRVLERWAVSVGDGIYGIPWTDIPRSQAPVLPDQIAIVVDQLVLRAPPQTRLLTELWYRTTLSRSDMARRLHVHRDTLYVRWNSSLHYFRDRFTSSPLSELRRLAADSPTEAPHKVVADFPTAEYKVQVDWASCRKAVPA